MKKMFFYLLVASMISIVIPRELRAAANPVPTEMTVDPILKKNLLEKMGELKILEKKNPESIDRKTLREKIEKIRTRKDEHGNIYIGISVSVLMLIIIILLLIIIF